MEIEKEEKISGVFRFICICDREIITHERQGFCSGCKRPYALIWPGVWDEDIQTKDEYLRAKRSYGALAKSLRNYEIKNHVV